MIIIRDPTLISTINDPSTRNLVSARFAQILAGESYDYNQHGYMIVVEEGGSITDLEAETSCILNYSDPDFIPYFEALEENDGCFEMLFILNDEVLPFRFSFLNGIDADLLKLFTDHAIPATAK